VKLAKILNPTYKKTTIKDSFPKRLFLFARKLLAQFPLRNGALPQAPRGVAAFL